MYGRSWLSVCLSALVLTGAVARAQTAPTFTKVKEIALPGAGSCDYVAVDADSKRVFVAHGTVIDVIDPTKGEKVGEVASVSGAHGAAFAPALKRGFATAGKTDRLVVFELDSLKAVKQVETGKSPDALLFVSAANEIWTMNGKSKDITCVSADKLEVVGTVALGGRPESAVEQVTKDGARVFVNLEDKNAIAVVDVKTRQVTATYPLTGCEGPTGLALDAEHGLLFAGCQKKLAVLEAATGKVLATPDIGAGCDAVAFDATSKLVFASCADGTTSVFHVDSATAVTAAGKITTMPGAKTCALDPKTHQLFLAVRPPKGSKEGVKLLVYAPAEAK